jgi:transcriptional regulator with GAF, ATPase, and Fis domain
LEEISQSIAAGAPINQIIMMVLEGIYRGLKLDRVAFCLVDPKRTWITARFGLGEKVEELLPLLKAPMHSRNNAMVLALENQKEILANPISRPLDRDYMGEAFWNASQSQTFLVIPIAVDKKPIGVIYVDRLQPRVPITEPDCQRIRTFRDQIIIAIRLSRRGLSG